MMLRRIHGCSLGLVAFLYVARAAAGQSLTDLKRANWVPSSSTPGTEVALVEQKREKSGETSKELRGATFVYYQLAAKGFEPQARYFVWISVSRAHPLRLAEVTLGDGGTVLDDKGKPLTIVTLVSRGEPFSVALASEDESKRAFGKVVPFPLTATDGGCTVEAEQVLPGMAYELRGHGFDSGESVKLMCDCKGKSETPKAEFAADDKGQWSTIVARDPAEKSERMKLLMHGKTCTVPLNLAFGKSALNYE